MKIFLSFILIFPFIMIAQSPIDSLIYYVKKDDYQKTIHFAKESKKQLDKYGISRSDETYLAFDYYLASSLISLQNFKEAEDILLKMIELRNKNNSNNTKDQALTLRALANLYVKQFNFAKAEALYDEIDSISEKINLKNTSFYANTLRIQAHLFIKQDSLDIAENYLKESVNVYNNIPDRNDEDILLSYYDLAEVYLLLESYSEAKIILEYFFKISKNKKSLISQYCDGLDLQARYYLGLNDIENSIKTIKESIRLKILDQGKDSSFLISSYNILFDIYISSKKIRDAEFPLIENLRLIELNYGTHHTKYYTKTLQAAAFYWEQYPNSEKAAQYIYSFSLEFKNRLKNKASYYSNSEMNIFLSNESYLRYFPLSFIRSANENYPRNNIEIFEIESIIKKFKLKNNQLTNSIIQKSDNEELKILYREYIELKKQSSKLELDQLEGEIENTEKKLQALTFSQKENILFGTHIFRDIKNKLKSNEIIYELVNYYYFDKDNGSTSQGVFDAFIINSRNEAPIFKNLFTEDILEIDIEIEENQVENINRVYENQYLSELFITPISKDINDIETIYIILSGQGYKINFSALPITTSQTLGEKYKVHVLGSSADVIHYSNTFFQKNEGLELLLYGDIDYDNRDINSLSIRDSIFTKNSKQFNELAIRSGINSWGYLPGSAQEVEAIKTSSKAQGFKSEIINGTSATKSSVVALDGRTSPYVLHLATHGFFFEDQKKEIQKSDSLNLLEMSGNQTESSFYKAADDPMLRSGLIFSGANKYWGKPQQGEIIDNGILTAKEISNLDLSSCELVVLSACETGLGDIKGSEGVYGLQRAFKMAGVKNIIMSLWKIPDAQTAELFDLFYSYCFEGISVHESLRMAQAEMKVKYSPYYWAGFVLLE